MDNRLAITASLYLKSVSREELYDNISRFGEEQLAGTIADALVLTRRVRPINTVKDLVEIINTIVKRDEARFSVLSRVFQALRIVINDEMGNLEKGLRGAQHLIKPGGRLVVISFHSLEDRQVKLFVKSGKWKLITKRPIVPTQEEQQRNKRSRSAKLRIVEKL